MGKKCSIKTLFDHTPTNKWSMDILSQFIQEENMSKVDAFNRVVAELKHIARHSKIPEKVAKANSILESFPATATTMTHQLTFSNATTPAPLIIETKGVLINQSVVENVHNDATETNNSSNDKKRMSMPSPIYTPENNISRNNTKKPQCSAVDDKQKSSDDNVASSSSDPRQQKHSTNYGHRGQYCLSTEEHGLSAANKGWPSEEGGLLDEEDDEVLSRGGEENTIIVTNDEFRRLVFEKGYKLFKGQLDLYDVLEINTAIRNVQPSTLGEFVDHLSHHLIGLKQTTPINETLKLSLSRVIYLVGGDCVEYYNSFFKQQRPNIKAKYEVLPLKKPSLPLGMTADMCLAYNEIEKEAKSGKIAVRKLVCAKKYALLDQGINDSEMMQMLDILDVIIASLPDRNEINSTPSNGQTELTHYRRVAMLLDIIFRKTKLEMKDGETCSKVTKEVRKQNACTYNDNDKKIIVGRRIDLLLSTMDVELGSSEWKKDVTSPGLGKQQQVKNARTNKAILKSLEKMIMDNGERDSLFVLGMDWIGQNGYMIGVKNVDDAYCAYHMGDMMIPPTLKNLKDFKNTLNILYQYKHHLINMTDIIEPAFYRAQAKEKLHIYRSPSPLKRSSSPNTLFTPVKKKAKRANTTNNDHDSEIDYDDYD